METSPSEPIYKKPLLWIILAAVLVCAAVAVCFLTMPKQGDAREGVRTCHGMAGLLQELRRNAVGRCERNHA